MTSPIRKPMLACREAPDIAALTYPLLATPKLDGIRCLLINGKAVSRTFKPIPNHFIRSSIESVKVDGLDGEILVRNRTFNELSGDVRREEGKPDFYFCVFDYLSEAGGGLGEGYQTRVARLRHLALPDFCMKLLPQEIKTPEELFAYEEEQVALGFEGVMTRHPDSPYKCGRSSMREEYLLKIKRFEDEEGTVVYALREMQNNNVATQDAFGRTERSKHKENLVAKDSLGALVVKPLKLGPISDADVAYIAANQHRLDQALKSHPYLFSIGTGYDRKTRDEVWRNRASIVGKSVVKYKHQPSGADTKPRFPVFLGFRDAFDMSE